METSYSKPQEIDDILPSSAKIIRSICDNFNLSLAKPEAVKADCDRLLHLMMTNQEKSILIDISPLYPLIRKRSGPTAEYVFSLLADTAELHADLTATVQALLCARDKQLVKRALVKATNLTKEHKLQITHSFLEFLANQFNRDESFFSDKIIAQHLAVLINNYQPKKPYRNGKIISALFAEDEHPDIRRMAAAILDQTEEVVDKNLIEKLLGENYTAFFYPYLFYTRASHLDLLCFHQETLASMQEDFINVRKIIGDKLLYAVISKVGWNRINSGIQAEALTGVTVGNSPTFLFPLSVAKYAERCTNVKKGSKLYLINTYGGRVTDALPGEDLNDPINRFRSYNLNHASLLNDFLDISPLSVEKVRDMIRRMDQITEDYAILFGHISNECAILPGVYKKIKDKILSELDKHKSKPQFSPELTRIVQSFEEPRSLGTARTLHGLKRYLHQNGLSMGFKLALNGRSPNRTADIIIADEDNIKFAYGKIRFADFEPQQKKQTDKIGIPYTVTLLLKGFARQMLHGQQNFPSVDIFCYGNEVHYYFGFRNHPAFLRIDYAPPVRGGMIDLEYFGVSNYELDQHPNISLDAIKRFFQSIDFEIQINSVRIHARYDKERALTLGDLCEKAQKIFRLAPYFMDIDWVIGSLSLDQKSKHKVTEAWINFFRHWGFIPINEVLTKDRTGILEELTFGPTGHIEKSWTGEGKYSDIYAGTSSAGFFRELIQTIRSAGLELQSGTVNEKKMTPGQIDFEERVLIPVKSAVDRGELIKDTLGLRLQRKELFKRINETEIFAELLSGDMHEIASAIRTARLVRPLERTIKFSSSGDVNGYAVQKSVLVLRGEEITIFILRGAKDMIRLAFFIQDHVIYKKRPAKSGAWISNANFNSEDLAYLLKDNDFIDTMPIINKIADLKKSAVFLEEIAHSVLPEGKTPLRGDRIVNGLKASPGYTVGKALFETHGRNPHDFKEAILVASSIGPEDTGFLYYASGIISTGGGILSHAGLIAMQFRKPALIVSGKWQHDSDNRLIMTFKSSEYKVIQKKAYGFRISIRTDIREKEYTLREGDLLILDAYAGTIRLLGQDNDICSMYEGFILYRRSAEMLTVVEDEQEILTLRGKVLRARHLLENVMQRCKDPVAARYAVFEILLNESLSGRGISDRDKSILLSCLLKNQFTGSDARAYLEQIPEDLKSGLRDAIHKAETNIPSSKYVFEILYLRLDIMHKMQVAKSAGSALAAFKTDTISVSDFDPEYIEKISRARLISLKKKLSAKTAKFSGKELNDLRLRHLLRQLHRINCILSVNKSGTLALEKFTHQLNAHDKEKQAKFADRIIIDSADCGFELYNYIGWKAANLAEIDRLSKKDLVPRWFAVTDLAFRKMMQSDVTEPETGGTKYDHSGLKLHEAISEILHREDLNNRRKSSEIRNLWERMKLPNELRTAVKEAYRNITRSGPDSNAASDLVYVAVRSSSLEEDTEAAAHAGEFETYLYIRGEEQLLYYLKQTWSGLWTERAIHSRSLQGGEASIKGGGLIVQRMVNSRVSGVLQTVNIPKGNIGEMVINVGLGLGEGVVSGAVSADQVTVTKGTDPEKELLRFSYITADKTKQIVFNKHAGFGTVAAQTVYHQRLRPAMEYVELCELVRNAAALEKSYGYPLDIEFGIEGDHLWILQARPVASFLSVLNETCESFPLARPAGGQKLLKKPINYD